MLVKKISVLSIVALIVTALGSSVALANTPKDALITTEVKAKLLEEKDIPSAHIHVTTKEGVVFLSGNVDTHLQLHKAVEVASSVEHVVDVIDSDLKIKDSKSFLSDASITAKVKGKIRHLYLHKRISEGYDLHVETINGVVHIFGHVAKSSDIEVITAFVKEIKGVKSVKTNIKY